jgi:hypothetical protein
MPHKGMMFPTKKMWINNLHAQAICCQLIAVSPPKKKHLPEKLIFEKV